MTCLTWEKWSLNVDTLLNFYCLLLGTRKGLIVQLI